MDPIDSIAAVFTNYCVHLMGVYGYICDVFESSRTDAAAIRHLTSSDLAPLVDPYRPSFAAQTEAERYSRCIMAMDEIKRAARRVLLVNFCGKDRYAVFSHEVCFSYACKVVVSMGPLVCHFSGAPSKDDIVNAELSLSINTPMAVFHADSCDLYCMESMSEDDSDFIQSLP